MTDRARDAIKRYERLKADRSDFETHWQECTDRVLPKRADFTTTRSPGEKRMQKVFDSTPIWANEQLAAGLHGLLTSPTLRWFSLRTENDRLNAVESIKLWLADTTERMYAVFNSPRHGFASQSHELYLDEGAIGTAIMAIPEGGANFLSFQTRHLNECVIAENDEGRIDTLYRCWPFTAKQGVQQFGKLAGKKALDAVEKGNPDEKVRYLHAVYPRALRDVSRGRESKHKPWESLYVALDDIDEIGEGGFSEFPYVCPRFSKVTGEIYGRSPAMTALPDIKQLNEMQKMVVKAAQKIIDPPLQLPDNGFIVPIKTLPASLNFRRAGVPDKIEPIATGGRPDLGIEMIGALRQQIIRSFFVEWLMLPSAQQVQDMGTEGKGVTATWVLQQRDEKMRLLSPMLARLQAEFLGPLIDRVFAIMWRRRLLAPPPPELSGVPLKVEYESPIAVSQRSSEMESLSRFFTYVAGVAQIDPRAAKVVDGVAAAQVGGKLLNVPPLVVKSPERVAEEIQQEEQAKQQMMQTAAAQTAAGAAKDGSAALKNVADAHTAMQPQGGADVQQAA